jgi:hypothetical protein
MKSTDKNTDQIVLDLLKTVEDKKQQIGNLERPSWITNCSFKFNPDANIAINLQTVRELATLVDIHSYLKFKMCSFKDSAAVLNLTNDVKFTYLGFSFEDWESDIKTRIAQLQIKSEKDKLARLEEKVNLLVSPEQRRVIELEKLVKELK